METEEHSDMNDLRRISSMIQNYSVSCPEKPDKRYLFQIKVYWLSIITLLSVLVTFVFCVLWTILFKLDDATSTHCGYRVKNYLPTISTAVGNYPVQRFIWTLVIIAHSPIRLIVVAIYYQYYTSIIKPSLHWCVVLLRFLTTVEVCSLVVLSIFTSSDYYSIHEKSFVTFICASELNMLISSILLKKGRITKTVMTKLEMRSLKYKICFTVFNMTSFAIAGYCFLRHNAYCESGVYTFFALFEYLVVLSNMTFHLTAVWDLAGVSLVVDDNLNLTYR
ncbi:post-GPI attachment to proteins factor 2 isoform X1 [Metopolophium dirhodum]|uniref:post-GPI attachment to proteins factor 2 isoform X1 n=2 Tax=Metopolophium dirhodum TaxID=44670 RepID=UPI00298FE0D7|nr:post-GPI attachment to proteins factor 2 isoform X1 [Metopolophium dirhodum]XP_060878654.1 post-GPI attachment to proteins factor 2 isoform X1 [Metopolophium dirhodum]XP_060878655.1 post-GPI attachment to proteins factor 2 isoform X1 [Metopolophium dirhodum]XP_060878657.1 post-GPI attachment to proteins factor 2 isoform X1 [Metopolophium dirhodum]